MTDHTIRISGPLTVASVPSHRAAILESLETGQASGLDLSKVTDADVSCVQMLLSAKRSAERRGVPLEMQNPSDAVTAAFTSAGVPWAAMSQSSFTTET